MMKLNFAKYSIKAFYNFIPKYYYTESREIIKELIKLRNQFQNFNFDYLKKSLSLKTTMEKSLVSQKLFLESYLTEFNLNKVYNII
jgi:hypothetical protein